MVLYAFKKNLCMTDRKNLRCGTRCVRVLRSIKIIRIFLTQPTFNPYIPLSISLYFILLKVRCWLISMVFHRLIPLLYSWIWGIQWIFIGKIARCISFWLCVYVTAYTFHKCTDSMYGPTTDRFNAIPGVIEQQQ